MRETYFVFLYYFVCVWTSFDCVCVWIFSMVDMYLCVVDISFYIYIFLCFHLVYKHVLSFISFMT